jgi:nicotinate-nucleotide pyrophosphorylase (carboxylating)
MYWNKEILKDTVKRALMEDIGMGDITTDNLISPEHKSVGFIVSKEDGVVAGLNVAKEVFNQVDNGIEFETFVKDGDEIKAGDKLAKLQGPTAGILKGERVALNFLQRLSGIATKTRKYVSTVKDLKVRIVDTRKTTPNLRMFEKYAVVVGGGKNHRIGLYDAVMIKDNHIIASGGIAKAVEKIREKIPHTTKIEVEVESLKEVKEAIESKADIIMLDNMSIENMKEAVKYINGRAIVEASGGINEKTLRQVAETGVDVISIGALTGHIKSLDISLDLKSIK